MSGRGGYLGPLPQAAAGSLAPSAGDVSGSYTNRSFNNDEFDTRGPASARSAAGQAPVSRNPFGDAEAEEVVFSSITQQQPPPRERPLGYTQGNQPALYSNAGAGDDAEGEQFEKIAVPLAIGSLGIGLPCLSVPATICAWGCCCCEPQNKKRRSICGIIFAAAAIACGVLIILIGVATWNNREMVLDYLHRHSNETRGSGGGGGGSSAGSTVSLELTTTNVTMLTTVAPLNGTANGTGADANSTMTTTTTTAVPSDNPAANSGSNGGGGNE